jgi:23S rRNA pseudouridine2604 synthase
MTDALGFKVIKLKRIRIMNLELGDLEYGKWRYLTIDELKKLNDTFKRANHF